MIQLQTPRVVNRSEEPILSAGYSPSGQFLVGVGGTMNARGCVVVWDTATLKRRAIAHLPRGESVLKLAFSPDETRLATASSAGTRIDLWHFPSLEPIRSHRIIREPYAMSVAGYALTETQVASLAFFPDGRRLAVGCWDCTAKVLDLDSDTLLVLGKPHRHNVDLVFPMDNHRLLTGSYDNLFAWELPAGKLVKRFPCGGVDNWTHVPLPGTTRLLSLSDHGKVRLWETSDGTYERHEIRYRPGTICHAYDPASGLFVIGQSNGPLVFWDVNQRKPAGKAKLCPDGYYCLDFAPNRRALCAVGAQVLEAEFVYR